MAPRHRERPPISNAGAPLELLEQICAVREARIVAGLPLDEVDPEEEEEGGGLLDCIASVVVYVHIRMM